MVRIGVMNLMVHGLTNPRFQVSGHDVEVVQRVQQIRHRTGKPDRSRAASTKATFGKRSRLSTTKTELLFVDRIMQLLKPGGRAAVIVPDGVSVWFIEGSQGCSQTDG